MFEKFTADARAAVMEATLVADSLGDRVVERQHLLVGLASADEPTLAAAGYTPAGLVQALRHSRSGQQVDADDAQALNAIGIDLDAIKEAVTRNFGPDVWDSATPPKRHDHPFLSRLLPYGSGRFAPGAKKTLELALREAIADRSRELSSTHVLRGLLRDPGSTTTALVSTRMSVDDLRARARRPG